MRSSNTSSARPAPGGMDPVEQHSRTGVGPTVDHGCPEFLLTNRSIPTGDFVRDEQAAVETRDILARFLSLELATVPVSPSSGGFTYRLDPALGTVVRSSDSFGPFFTERSLTSGRARRRSGSAIAARRSTISTAAICATERWSRPPASCAVSQCHSTSRRSRCESAPTR